jgi:O-methyltransferase
MPDQTLSFTVNAAFPLPDGRRLVPGPPPFPGSAPEQTLGINVNLDFPLADGRTLVQGPLTYDTDGFATKHNADFIQDPRFARAYERGLAVPHPYGPNLHFEWRVYTACWVASNALRLPGDLVECGVATGIFSRAICYYSDFGHFADKTFWLLDTYEGYPAAQATAAERSSGLTDRLSTYYSDTYDVVRESFEPFPNVRLVKGMIPETLPEVTSERIAYLSLDCNAAAPELASIETFWDRLVPGAFILMDDYGWAPCFSQKQAMDGFAAKHGLSVFSLPTGQGLLIKP